MRRRKQASARVETGPLVAGELEIRADQFQAFARGTSVDLTRREFEVLQLLAQTAGKVLQREEIYQSVWGYAMAHGDRSVDVFVRKVRQKLEKASPDWNYIHTHFGVGYRFQPERAGGDDGDLRSTRPRTGGPTAPRRCRRSRPRTSWRCSTTGWSADPPRARRARRRASSSAASARRPAGTRRRRARQLRRARARVRLHARPGLTPASSSAEHAAPSDGGRSRPHARPRPRARPVPAPRRRAPAARASAPCAPGATARSAAPRDPCASSCRSASSPSVSANATRSGWATTTREAALAQLRGGGLELRGEALERRLHEQPAIPRGPLRDRLELRLRQGPGEVVTQLSAAAELERHARVRPAPHAARAPARRPRAARSRSPFSHAAWRRRCGSRRPRRRGRAPRCRRASPARRPRRAVDGSGYRRGSSGPSLRPEGAASVTVR